MSSTRRPSRFRELCNALNDTLTPALRAAGYAPPAEPFNRSTVRYEFKRAADGGIQTIAVLFNRARAPEFSLQVFVEPPQGLAAVEAAGGTLVVGTVSPARSAWPAAVATFSLDASLLDRLLGRPARSPQQVVDAALALLPEIEGWWRDPGPTAHILTSTVRYPGRA